MTKRILLVENDPKQLRLLRVSLEQEGYPVVTAEDGRIALARLEDGGIELVITAAQLPRLDGFALVDKMQRHPEWRELPVVLMIEGETRAQKLRGLELGVEDFVTKPVFVKELVGHVRVLLAKQVRERLSMSGADSAYAGSLDDMAVIDLLESLENGHQSGVVRFQSGSREATVYFRKGAIIDAVLNRLRGEEAVFRLLGWTDGRFEVRLEPMSRQEIVAMGTRELLEAGIRHAAEYTRLVQTLPPLDAVMQVDRAELLSRMDQIPEQLDDLLRLFDGSRSVYDVIDESPFDDLSTLGTLNKLYLEKLLMETDAEPTSGTRSSDLSGAPKASSTRAVDSGRTAPSESGAPPPVETTARAVAEALEWDDRLIDDVVSAKAAEATQAPEAPDEPTLTRELTAAETNAAPGSIRHQSVVRTDKPPAAFGEETMVLGSGPPDKPSPMPVASDPPPRDTERDEAPPVTPRAGSGGLTDGKPDARAKAPSAPPRKSEPPKDKSEPPKAAVEPAKAKSDPPKVEAKRKSEPPKERKSKAPAKRKSIPGERKSQPGERKSAPPKVEAEKEPAKLAQAPDSDPLAKTAPSAAAPAELRDAKPKTANIPVSVAPVSAPPSAGKKSDLPLSSSSHDLAPSSSGPRSLGESGISTQFFAAPPPESAPPDSLDEHHDQPVYLTREQIERRQKNKKMVMIVVGAVAALGFFGLIGPRFFGSAPEEPKKPAPSAKASAKPPASASTRPASSAIDTPAGTPTPILSASATPSASASASAEPSAKPSDGEALPDVADPLKEALNKLNIGDMKGAIPFAKAAIRKDPENADGYYALYTAYSETGKSAEAKQALEDCSANATKGQYKGYCPPKKK